LLFGASYVLFMEVGGVLGWWKSLR
jgi:hypothetical protein